MASDNAIFGIGVGLAILFLFTSMAKKKASPYLPPTSGGRVLQRIEEIKAEYDPAPPGSGDSGPFAGNKNTSGLKQKSGTLGINNGITVPYAIAPSTACLNNLTSTVTELPTGNFYVTISIENTPTKELLASDRSSNLVDIGTGTPFHLWGDQRDPKRVSFTANINGHDYALATPMYPAGTEKMQPRMVPLGWCDTGLACAWWYVINDHLIPANLRPPVKDATGMLLKNPTGDVYFINDRFTYSAAPLSTIMSRQGNMTFKITPTDGAVGMRFVNVGDGRPPAEGYDSILIGDAQPITADSPFYGLVTAERESFVIGIQNFYLVAAGASSAHSFIAENWQLATHFMLLWTPSTINRYRVRILAPDSAFNWWELTARGTYLSEQGGTLEPFLVPLGTNTDGFWELYTQSSPREDGFVGLVMNNGRGLFYMFAIEVGDGYTVTLNSNVKFPMDSARTLFQFARTGTVYPTGPIAGSGVGTVIPPPGTTFTPDGGVVFVDAQWPPVFPSPIQYVATAPPPAVLIAIRFGDQFVHYRGDRKIGLTDRAEDDVLLFIKAPAPTPELPGRFQLLTGIDGSWLALGVTSFELGIEAELIEPFGGPDISMCYLNETETEGSRLYLERPAWLVRDTTPVGPLPEPSLQGTNDDRVRLTLASFTPVKQGLRFVVVTEGDVRGYPQCFSQVDLSVVDEVFRYIAGFPRVVKDLTPLVIANGRVVVDKSISAVFDAGVAGTSFASGVLAYAGSTLESFAKLCEYILPPERGYFVRPGTVIPSPVPPTPIPEPGPAPAPEPTPIPEPEEPPEPEPVVPPPRPTPILPPGPMPEPVEPAPTPEPTPVPVPPPPEPVEPEPEPEPQPLPPPAPPPPPAPIPEPNPPAPAEPEPEPVEKPIVGPPDWVEMTSLTFLDCQKYIWNHHPSDSGEEFKRNLDGFPPYIPFFKRNAYNVPGANIRFDGGNGPTICATNGNTLMAAYSPFAANIQHDATFLVVPMPTVANPNRLVMVFPYAGQVYALGVPRTNRVVGQGIQACKLDDQEKAIYWSYANGHLFIEGVAGGPSLAMQLSKLDSDTSVNHNRGEVLLGELRDDEASQRALFAITEDVGENLPGFSPTPIPPTDPAAPVVKWFLPFAQSDNMVSYARIVCTGYSYTDRGNLQYDSPLVALKMHGPDPRLSLYGDSDIFEISQQRVILPNIGWINLFTIVHRPSSRQLLADFPNTLTSFPLDLASQVPAVTTSSTLFGLINGLIFTNALHPDSPYLLRGHVGKTTELLYATEVDLAGGKSAPNVNWDIVPVSETEYAAYINGRHTPANEQSSTVIPFASEISYETRQQAQRVEDMAISMTAAMSKATQLSMQLMTISPNHHISIENTADSVNWMEGILIDHQQENPVECPSIRWTMTQFGSSPPVPVAQVARFDAPGAYRYKHGIFVEKRSWQIMRQIPSLRNISPFFAAAAAIASNDIPNRKRLQRPLGMLVHNFSSILESSFQKGLLNITGVRHLFEKEYRDGKRFGIIIIDMYTCKAAVARWNPWADPAEGPTHSNKQFMNTYVSHIVRQRNDDPNLELFMLIGNHRIGVYEYDVIALSQQLVRTGFWSRQFEDVYPEHTGHALESTEELIANQMVQTSALAYPPDIAGPGEMFYNHLHYFCTSIVHTQRYRTPRGFFFSSWERVMFVSSTSLRQSGLDWHFVQLFTPGDFNFVASEIDLDLRRVTYNSIPLSAMYKPKFIDDAPGAEEDRRPPDTDVEYYRLADSAFPLSALMIPKQNAPSPAGEPVTLRILFPEYGRFYIVKNIVQLPYQFGVCNFTVNGKTYSALVSSTSSGSYPRAMQPRFQEFAALNPEMDGWPSDVHPKYQQSKYFVEDELPGGFYSTLPTSGFLITEQTPPIIQPLF